jgi:hypothetical protein
VIPNAGVLGFSENRYTNAGAPISRAIVRFNHQPGSFALDNLSYLPIPEPSTFAVGSVVFIAMFLTRPMRKPSHRNAMGGLRRTLE